MHTKTPLFVFKIQRKEGETPIVPRSHFYRWSKHKIRDKEYEFLVTTAICKECGEEMSIPGLMDYNVQEVDNQYRSAEKIVTISDIQKLMSMYNIGKAPLSLALGFGEVTISRYLDGQVPSKEYSDIIQHALFSAEYMETLLRQNKEKVGETAYKKAIIAVNDLKSLYRTVSPKLLSTIAYIFSELKEVTPLMLQKLLYYIQGIYYALYNSLIFEEQCEAWLHGPVYRNVYTLFRDFKYNPIDDARFSLLMGWNNELTSTEIEVIKLVLNTFGLYSGKVLEKITHKETPWKEARIGYSNNTWRRKIPSIYYNDRLHIEFLLSIYLRIGLTNTKFRLQVNCKKGFYALV